MGRFPETASQVPDDTRFALVHLDADLYAPTHTALEFFWPRIVAGGIVIAHDYNNGWTGSRKAVDAFCDVQRLVPVEIPDEAGSVVLTKPVA